MARVVAARGFVVELAGSGSPIAAAPRKLSRGGAAQHLGRFPAPGFSGSGFSGAELHAPIPVGTGDYGLPPPNRQLSHDKTSTRPRNANVSAHGA